MYQSKHKDWHLKADHGKLSISRGEDEFSFSAVEGAKIKTLLNATLRMRGMAVLPPMIRDDRITVHINKEDILVSFAGEKEGLLLEWNDIDNVMVAIDETVKMGIDEKTLSR
jgi:hypothetical protein